MYKDWNLHVTAVANFWFYVPSKIPWDFQSDFGFWAADLQSEKLNLKWMK